MRRLGKRCAMILDSVFVGRVDAFENGIATGWALDHRRPKDSIDVDLYVDGERAAKIKADKPRPDLLKLGTNSDKMGFICDVRPYTKSEAFPRLELYFGDTCDRIAPSQSAARFINRPIINLGSLGHIGYSAWIPTPSAEIVKYITGRHASEEDQKRNYLISGMINSADVYNLILDLGLDASRTGFRILDLGCGSGRYAPFLKQFMPGCEYLGLDVWPEAIEWAAKTITAVYPDVKFVLLDKSKGYLGDTAFNLPVGNKYAQVVMAMSLFTHLSPNATAGYFKKIGLALSDEGAALLTFRILDEVTSVTADAAAEKARMPMSKTPEAWWYGSEGYLDIYYTEIGIQRMAKEAGLEILSIRRGYWGRPNTEVTNLAAYQDMVLLKRA